MANSDGLISVQVVQDRRGNTSLVQIGDQRIPFDNICEIETKSYPSKGRIRSVVRIEFVVDRLELLVESDKEPTNG